MFFYPPTQNTRESSECIWKSLQVQFTVSRDEGER